MMALTSSVCSEEAKGKQDELEGREEGRTKSEGREGVELT